MVFTSSKLHSTTLDWTGGFDLKWVARNTIAFNCSTDSKIPAGCFYKPCINRIVWKSCAHVLPLSLFICCFKDKFHMQTRSWLQKANYSRLRKLEASALLFICNWMSSTHECCFEASLSYKPWCKYSILLPLPLPSPYGPHSCNPDFLLSLGLTVVLS